MRKILSYTVIALLAMHITVSFGNAEETIENVELNSAPIEQVAPIPEGNTWTSWELMHRTRMLDGFTWIGKVAEYITPRMWGGIANNSTIDAGAIYSVEPTNYTECVQSEMDASFGENGSMIESTPTAELKNLAKYCATEFYGDYFSGKKYTTREEMTMFLLTALGEDISLEGEFVGSAFVTNGTGTVTPFNNVVKTAWYAPFLARGTEVNLLSSNPPRWNTAREVTDENIVEMLQGYFQKHTLFNITVEKTTLTNVLSTITVLHSFGQAIKEKVDTDNHAIINEQKNALQTKESFIHYLQTKDNLFGYPIVGSSCLWDGMFTYSGNGYKDMVCINNKVESMKYIIDNKEVPFDTYIDFYYQQGRTSLNMN